MSTESTYERLSAAIISGDKNKLLVVVEEALQEGLTPSDIIEKGMSPGMKEVGGKVCPL